MLPGCKSASTSTSLATFSLPRKQPSVKVPASALARCVGHGAVVRTWRCATCVVECSLFTSRVSLSAHAQEYLMDRSDVRPNERGGSVHLPRHKGDQESATSTNQLNHNAQCPLRCYGGDWPRHVTSASALPCALRRCGACIVMLHKTRAPSVVCT